MKKLGVIVVSYGSVSVEHCVSSIHSGLGQNHADVVVVENAPDFERRVGDFVQVNCPWNPGYWNGAVTGAQYLPLPLREYDFLLICNADIEVDDLTHLFDMSCEGVGALAPSIRGAGGKQYNPFMNERMNRTRLGLMSLFYQIPEAGRLWMALRALLPARRDRRSSSVMSTRQEIYAPHGSAILLTSDFIRKYSLPALPIFLFGEEIIVAELCRQANLKVKYIPELTLYHLGSESIGGLSRPSHLIKTQGRSLAWIRKVFYD